MGQLRTANTRHRRAVAALQARTTAAKEGAALQQSAMVAQRAPAPGGDGSNILVELIGTATLPDGGQLRLFQRGADFSIRFGSNELMGNQAWHSEEALAILTCARLHDPAARILIGGLGMGFTLGGALRSLTPAATIVVAELVPEIVTWAHGPLAHIFGDSLADPRVSIEMADVHDVIVREPGGFDAILLDVDNGPDGLIHLPNERLYCNWGLRAAYAALKPAGVLAVWSAHPDPMFLDRLEAAGFVVEEIGIGAFPGDEEETHTIWLASRPE